MEGEQITRVQLGTRGHWTVSGYLRSKICSPSQSTSSEARRARKGRGGAKSEDPLLTRTYTHVLTFVSALLVRRDNAIILVLDEEGGLPNHAKLGPVPPELSAPAQALGQQHPELFLLPNTCAFRAVNGQHRAEIVMQLENDPDRARFGHADCWWQAYIFKAGRWSRSEEELYCVLIRSSAIGADLMLPENHQIRLRYTRNEMDKVKPTTAGEAFRQIYGLWRRQERPDAFNLAQHIRTQDAEMLPLWRDLNGTATYPTTSSASLLTLAKKLASEDALKHQLNCVR